MNLKETQKDIEKKISPMLNKDYFFESSYESITDIPYGSQKAIIIEKYTYGGAKTYSSLFYNLLKNITKISKLDDTLTLEKKARKALKNKKILELGCGPGFFMYSLKELGAEVTGIEINDGLKDKINPKLDIIFGDARNLNQLTNENYDIILSKDFLSISVTKSYGNEIMEKAYSRLKKKGLSIHQIDYFKRNEEEYLRDLEEVISSKKVITQIKKSWENIENKELILRNNILNVGLDSLTKMGYKLLTNYKLDIEDKLTITLEK